MAISKNLALSVVIILSAHYAISASAKAPEFCFQSPQDYQIYQKYGDDAPDKPAQRKEIIINVKGSAANGTIILDASESTTPSGKIQFVWGNPAKPTSTESRFSYKGSNEPAMISVPLTIKDPVCEWSEYSQATYSAMPRRP